MNRNNPCPCGSGRKYKRCCLGRAAREALAWKQHSAESMFDMAKARGMSVAALADEHTDARLRARFLEVDYDHT